jgi:hypothetical protein
MNLKLPSPGVPPWLQFHVGCGLFVVDGATTLSYPAADMSEQLRARLAWVERALDGQRLRLSPELHKPLDRAHEEGVVARAGDALTVLRRAGVEAEHVVLDALAIGCDPEPILCDYHRALADASTAPAPAATTNATAAPRWSRLLSIIEG